MNTRYAWLRVCLIVALWAPSFHPPVAQADQQGPTYVVVIQASDARSQSILTQLAITGKPTQNGRYIAYVTDSQLADLKVQGLRVEILKTTGATKPATPASGLLSNQYLTLTVLDTGQFTMQTSDGRYLLYPGGYTSYLSVNVDGLIYNNRDGSLTVATPFTSVDANTAYIQYLTPENILVTQHYILSGQGVQFQVDAVNQGTSPHAVSVRYLMDTQIDINDGSPLYAPTVGVRTYETDLPQPSFSTWLAYDIWPNPNLTAVGTFATQPSRVVFAWWPNAFQYSWDYTANPNQAFYTPGYTYSPYSDSCVLIYLDMGVLSGGAQNTVSTYYGTGAPSSSNKRDQLISTFYQFKEAIKASITADVSAFASLYADYYVSLRPTWKDYVEAAWTLSGVDPDPTKVAKLGKDAALLKNMVDVIGYVGVANTFFLTLGNELSSIPASASETDVQNDYVYAPLMNSVTFTPKTGGTYQGVSAYLAAIDSEYQADVALIPASLPDSVADEQIAFLEQQIAALNASTNQETLVPSYANIQCSLVKLGVVQEQKASMASQANYIGAAGDVSFATTLTDIAAVLGGAGLKIAGVVGEPVTLGGSTVVLISSEAVLWSGVADIVAISDLIGAGTDVASFTLQGSMTLLGYKAVSQLANDLEVRRAVFRGTADWLTAAATMRPAQTQPALDQSAIQVNSFQVSDLVIAQDQSLGQGSGQVVVTNNGSSTVNVGVYGSLTAVLNNTMPTVGLLGSSFVSVPPGQQRTLTFSYQLLRSSLLNYLGYHAHLFVAAADGTGAVVVGPFVAHFYAGTATQLATLNAQTFTSLARGILQEGQEMSTTVQFASGIQNAQMVLSYAEGAYYDLHLYDAYGNHVGVNYTTGLVENQIPGASYSGPNTWPEWISVQNPGNGNYVAAVVALNSAAGAGYDLSMQETPQLAAILDAPAAVNWDVTLLAHTSTVTQSFGLQIAEGAGSQDISNLQITPSDLSGGATIIPASQLSCATPSAISAGSSVLATCVLAVAPQVPVGIYVGDIQISGQDSGGHPLTVTTQANVSIQEPFWKIRLPFVIR